MCGLAGYWARRSGPVDAAPMADALLHRGPDDGGAWSDSEAGIALSHRRLSIVDLSAAGHQPMASPSGRYVLVYNGEIYNHAAIRAELDTDAPRQWHGHSDTETLLAAIERWGLAAALQRSIGMFALALWDRQERALSLARDRLGEKPLYYGWSSGGGIVFGSELKALRAAPGFANPVSDDALALYLRFNYVPAPWSILTGIFKVEPGTIVLLDRTAHAAAPSAPPSVTGVPTPGVACQRFWSLDDVVAAGADEGMTAEDAIDRIEGVLTNAVALQNVADVPVGAFLSGGVDSSTIVALLAKTASARVRTFSMGFAETEFDEAPFARAVARHLGTDHTEAYVTPEDVRALIPQLPAIYDEPFADSSQLPTILLSRLARSQVTVALSGDAGDELFGGYNRYLASGRLGTMARLMPAGVRRGLGRAITALPPARWDLLARLSFLRGTAMAGLKAHKVGHILQSGGDARAMYRSASEQWLGRVPFAVAEGTVAPVDRIAALRDTAAEQMMQWDMASYLPDDILAKVDRAAMSASLETRVPFLDYRVVEAAWRVPLRFKIRDGAGKWVIRQILYRHVPAALIERPKAGFAIPVGQWLRGPLRPWAEDLLSGVALARHPGLDAVAIRLCWHEHCEGTRDWTGALWGVLMFQAWLTEWGGSDRRIIARDIARPDIAAAA